MTAAQAPAAPVPEPTEGLALVRGAAGFLGSHLALRLHARGVPLRLQVRHRERLPAALRQATDVEVVESDAVDPDATRAAVAGVACVYEMIGATVPATAGPLAVELELCLRPLAVLLDALAAASGTLLVYPSSGGTVYGRTLRAPIGESSPLRPESTYGVGKVLGEEMVRFHTRRHGTGHLVVRMGNPYGRGGPIPLRQGVVDVFLQRLLAGQPVEVWGGGDQVRDYLLVDDTIDALEALVASGRREGTFNVGSGVGHSVDEIIAALEEVSGRRLDRRRRDDVSSGIPYNVLDVSALVAATGWRPRHDLRSGLAVAWQRALGTE